MGAASPTPSPPFCAYRMRTCPARKSRWSSPARTAIGRRRILRGKCVGGLAPRGRLGSKILCLVTMTARALRRRWSRVTSGRVQHTGKPRKNLQEDPNRVGVKLNGDFPKTGRHNRCYLRNCEYHSRPRRPIHCRPVFIVGVSLPLPLAGPPRRPLLSSTSFERRLAGNCMLAQSDKNASPKRGMVLGVHGSQCWPLHFS